MNCAERVAEYVNGETVTVAGLFQRRGTAAAIGDEDFLDWQHDWLAENSRG
jgi:hypothetical protein